MNPIMHRPARRLAHSPKVFSFAALAVGATLFGLLVLRARWHALWAYLVAVNAVELLLCAYDKLIAGSRGVRVPERLLHIVALLGGSPALLAAMAFFRHKSRKMSFKVFLVVVLALQAAAVAGWMRWVR